jgi:hypothetical protein
MKGLFDKIFDGGFENGEGIFVLIFDDLICIFLLLFSLLGLLSLFDQNFSFLLNLKDFLGGL